MKIDIRNKPFDINSNIKLHNKPNAELEFSSDVKSVEVIVTDINGRECRKKLIMDKERSEK